MARTKKKGQTPPRDARLQARGRGGRAPTLPDRDRAKRRANIITATIVFALIAAVVVAVVVTRRSSQRPEEPPEGVETFQVASANHVDGPVQYEQTPPAGGDHNAVWQNCGFYRSPIASENAVHSLEHGAVWITYRPDLPADQVEAIRDLARDRTFVLASPFADVPSPVVASAWGVQLQVDSAGDERLREFVDYYRSGPQTPEPGATCSGGIGEPQ